MNNNKDLAWQDIEWQLVKKVVLRLQRRIYKARKSGDFSRVHWLQKKLIKNYEAKLYSVFQVSTLNRSKTFPEVETFVATTSSQKLELAKSLKLDGRAYPVRKFRLSKAETFSKKVYELFAIRDRAKQALCKLALEPEWEAVFEENSFGFRPGRCIHDAVEAIYLSTSSNIIKNVYSADLTRGFEKINHKALLKKMHTFLLIEEQVKAWLEAGILESYSRINKRPALPTMETPQGGVIAPLLTNIALQGLETQLRDLTKNLKFKVPPTGGSHARRRSVGFVRYADCLIIMHREPEILEQLISFSNQWLQELGLKPSQEDVCVKNGRQGFEFFGFQFIQLRKKEEKNITYKISITPSRKSKAEFLLKVREIIQKQKAVSSYVLINSLRPITLSWASFYKYCECSEPFSKISNQIFQKIRAWVFRRHPRKSRTTIRNIYFPKGNIYFFCGTPHENNWVLNGRCPSAKKEVNNTFLPHISWVHSEKFVKVKQNKSPFDSDDTYWKKRMKTFAVSTNRQAKLLDKQKYRCKLCGYSFDFLDVLEIDHIIPQSQGGKHDYSNLQIVHKECHVKKSRSEYKKNKKTSLLLQEPDEVKVSSPVLKTR